MQLNEIQEMLQQGAQRIAAGEAGMASQLSYAMNGGTVLLGLSMQSWAAIVGIIGVVVTAMINAVFKRRELKAYQRHLELVRQDLKDKGIDLCEKR